MTSDFTERYITARRRVIEKDFDHLNEVQKKAVMTTDGPLLLLAGAGSGKTTVLINRIANILRYGSGADTVGIPPEHGEAELEILEKAVRGEADADIQAARAIAAFEPTEPWRVMAITFTNKAAEELKNRLHDMLGDTALDIWAMTFHSACVRILRRYADRMGLQSNFTIYDTSDSASLMKRILKEMDLDEKTFPHKSVLSQISRAKDARITAEAYLKTAETKGDIRQMRCGEAYVEYQSRMKAANAMDFDDLIFNAVRVLLEYEEARDYYQRRFKYVLVDEYQDTNNLQYLFASTIAGGYENICVVGDDDQSIYKFRGATIENILNFENQYKNARIIRLEQNYRSSGNILDAANAVIQNNTERKGKQLWTNSDQGEKLTLYVAQTERDEAQYVASKIIADVSAGGNWRDSAVLYRMNSQSNQLEYAFKRNGIPYRIIGGTRFYDRAEVKDVLAYLCVIMTPSDDLRLTRIINNPTRGIGLKSIETAQAVAADEGCALFEVLERADAYPDLQRAAIKFKLFANMINELAAAAKELPIDSFFDKVLEMTGYVRALEEKGTEDNVSRVENVLELKTNIAAYMEESGEGTLEGFLSEVALYSDIDQYDSNTDSVVMMTMHSAKGLEFPIVYIVGAEEGIFPGTRSIGEPQELEEERRLCYVALTRAMKKLTIVCTRQRKLFGMTSANRVSRFIEEIPEDNIEMTKAESPAYSGGLYASGSFNTLYAGTASAAPAAKPVRQAAKPTQPAVSLKNGDMVEHKAFGRGMVVAMTPMGGDFLVEIAFDGIGTKRLMLRAAAQYIKKAQ